MELDRASKTSKKRKHVSYRNALMAEVHEFSESTKSKIERGMKGQELVNEVVMEWENVVNRVAKCELGEKIKCVVEQLGGGMSRLKIQLTQNIKYIRRLLMVGKICGVSIVDYGKRSNN